MYMYILMYSQIFIWMATQMHPAKMLPVAQSALFGKMEDPRSIPRSTTHPGSS